MSEAYEQLRQKLIEEPRPISDQRVMQLSEEIRQKLQEMTAEEQADIHTHLPH